MFEEHVPHNWTNRLTHVDIEHLIHYPIIILYENYAMLTQPNLKTSTKFGGISGVRKKIFTDFTCMDFILNHKK